MVHIQGPIVALLTPFDETGAVDWHNFKTYLAALRDWGIRTVISNGTTGEFPSLTINERQQVVEFVRNNFAGTIINNVSATNVSDVRDLIAGTQGYADFLLILPPYYYSACTDTGLCRFFVSSLSGTSLPVLLYHFPQHTGNRLTVELVAMLLEHGIAIRGIKDSSGSIDNALLYHSNFPQLNIFLGNDDKAFEALQKNLSGSVTGAANPLPELLIAMRSEYPSNAGKAQSLQRCLDVWNAFRNSSGYPEIPLVKAAMGARIDGFPLHVRAPFTPLPNEEIDRIRKLINRCMRDFEQLIVTKR